ncbi:superoxide dismutase [Thermophagus xiamenensis]|uniref:Superoxide dismutase n=1 Tax=Thermophagus xiamenensis TaxID=385682 RepID=A0A1I1VUU8_9BACT|nr:superoxide dismutase [Thermophagus xiamenensis]SFD86856.1 superoxide dismutase, Fe-Mn family [Thermophagus xiamenensis]
MERRHFLSLLGMAALGACVPGGKKGNANGSTMAAGSFSGHLFPELGYAYDALEPYIDAQTMELHYDKHHRGYYTKFMKAIEGTGLTKTPMPQIFAKISQYSDTIRNNGGGFYNHQLFWENMSPNGGEPSARLLNALVKNFGSFDAFKEAFGNAAKSHFGSGWAWLYMDAEKNLKITSTPNQDNPLMDISPERGIPLLALDVWEHAYYLKYQNKRGEYVDNFWKVVNWKTVSTRWELAIKGEWKG